MTDTLQRQALIRDLARRLETLTPDQLHVLNVVARRIELLVAHPVRARPAVDGLDPWLADMLDDAYAERRAAEQRHEAERDELVREWATESTVGTVCSDESLAIARTVTAERSDPYETVVVVDVEGGGTR